MLISLSVLLRLATNVCTLIGWSSSEASQQPNAKREQPFSEREKRLCSYHIQLFPHGPPFSERGRHLRDDRVLHRDDCLELPADTRARGYMVDAGQAKQRAERPSRYPLFLMWAFFKWT